MRAPCDGEVEEEDNGEQQQQQQQQQRQQQQHTSVFGQMMTPSLAGQCAFCFWLDRLQDLLQLLQITICGFHQKSAQEQL